MTVLLLCMSYRIHRSNTDIQQWTSDKSTYFLFLSNECQKNWPERFYNCEKSPLVTMVTVNESQMLDSTFRHWCYMYT